MSGGGAGGTPVLVVVSGGGPAGTAGWLCSVVGGGWSAAGCAVTGEANIANATAAHTKPMGCMIVSLPTWYAYTIASVGSAATRSAHAFSRADARPVVTERMEFQR